MSHGELSIEQKMGYYFATKKKYAKNRLLLKNWRPISLLNMDYKILAKVLATRIQNVLLSIINDDHTDYLKGRYIGQNIRIKEDISFFTKISKIPRIILCFDFGKAFDSLNLYCYVQNSPQV